MGWCRGSTWEGAQLGGLTRPGKNAQVESVPGGLVPSGKTKGHQYLDSAFGWRLERILVFNVKV